MSEEVVKEMSRRRPFREARARAASALLAYLGNPCPSTEHVLLDATHDLEAAATLRRLNRVSQRRQAAQLHRLIAH